MTVPCDTKELPFSNEHQKEVENPGRVMQKIIFCETAQTEGARSFLEGACAGRGKRGRKSAEGQSLHPRNQLSHCQPASLCHWQIF